MLRAGQQQIFQETNVRLVELRHLEIDYYFTVNAAIGTQSVLIGGFAYGLFTKNTFNGTEYGKISLAVFYVTSAITIFASIHVVVMSLLLQVYGPGLALHGPSGSMARAAEVMLDEQRQVMFGFILMMSFFAISTVMCFWIAMDLYSACICTAIFFIAVRQWIFYWRRVYFKLYWDRSRAKRMFEDVRHNDSDEPSMRPSFAPNKAPLNKTSNANAVREENTSDFTERPSMLDQTRKSLANIFQRSSIVNPRTSTTATGPNTSDTNNPIHPQTALDPKAIVMEGYLTKKTLMQRKSMVSGSITPSWSQWERRYCVINGRGQLIAYKSRQEFRAKEPSSLKERPLDLEAFWIYFDANVPNEDFADETRSVVSSATGVTTSGKTVATTTGNSSNNREMFRMTLISKEADVSRKFLYRCDTEEELEMWYEAVEQLLPHCLATPDNNAETAAAAADAATTNRTLFDPNQHPQGLSTMIPTTYLHTNNNNHSSSNSNNNDQTKDSSTDGTSSGSNSRRNSFRASFSLASGSKK